jgi:hypothetical protein
VIEIEYGDEAYIAGKHVPDCPSQHPGETRIEGSNIFLDVYVCTGCLPIEDPA